MVARECVYVCVCLCNISFVTLMHGKHRGTGTPLVAWDNDAETTSNTRSIQWYYSDVCSMFLVCVLCLFSNAMPHICYTHTRYRRTIDPPPCTQHCRVLQRSLPTIIIICLVCVSVCQRGCTDQLPMPWQRWAYNKTKLKRIVERDSVGSRAILQNSAINLKRQIRSFFGFARFCEGQA